MERVGMVLFAAAILALLALDVGMVVSLVRPGDERRQLVVWKASTATLLGVVGSMLIDMGRSWFAGEMVVSSPFVQLGATATIYFGFLLYFKRRYGG